MLAYYALVFTISWGGILFAVGVGPGGLPATKEQAEMLFPFVLLALFAGPSVAGIVLTGLSGLLSGSGGKDTRCAACDLPEERSLSVHRGAQSFLGAVGDFLSVVSE